VDGTANSAPPPKVAALPVGQAASPSGAVGATVPSPGNAPQHQPTFAERYHRFEGVLKKAIFTTNIIGAVVAAAFVVLGIAMVLTPPRKRGSNFIKQHFHSMFWVVQGFYLAALSGIACGATIYAGILRRDFADCYRCLRINTWVGALRYEFGRAIFFCLVGYYVFELVDEFQEEADLCVPWMWKFLGIVSMSCGLFEGIFDVVVYNFMLGIDELTESTETKATKTNEHAYNTAVGERPSTEVPPVPPTQSDVGYQNVTNRSLLGFVCCSSAPKPYERLGAP
jgi:hypothetical protein